MKLSLVLLAVVALGAIACVAAEESTSQAAVVPGSVSKSGKALGRKFGDFLKQRLRWKLKEYKVDLQAAQREVGFVKALNADFCRHVPRRPSVHKIAKAKAAVRFWKQVVASRKSVLSFHKKRHLRYRGLHKYMKKGPKKMRRSVALCRKSGKKHCARRWCKKHRKGCARWRESRRYYRNAKDKRHILKKHARRQRTHVRRYRRALGALKRAIRRAAYLGRKARKNRGVKRCKYHAKRRLRRWSRAVLRLKVKIAKLKRGFGKIKSKIAKREKRYKKFKFSWCRKFPRGRHHAFTCRRGRKAARRVFRFKRCRIIRRHSKKHKRVIRFRRCYK